MKASKFMDAQKAFIVKQGEEGTSVAEQAVNKIKFHYTGISRYLLQTFGLPLLMPEKRTWPMRLQQPA